ncbi:MAG: twin-arginine translocation signal domain-containing protein, partial [Chlorobia bacterium]|nr:twin-arginine translocation signal domain-containing protein [Fimbriimonadaceae bacterium]
MTRRDFIRAGGIGAAALVLPNIVLAQGEHDLVILNGRVLDPETKLYDVRHLGIRNGRIASISQSELKGRKSIDAKGLVVAPGFIDIIAHGHDLENDRLQLMDGVTTKLQMEAGALEVDKWYRDQFGNRMCNYGCAASHTQSRRKVMNEKDEPSSDAQVAEMARLVDAGLREGGLGVGFGLEYQPAATRWEVLEMFRVAGKYGASCHVHSRYGTLLEEQSNLTALAEVLSASLISGAPIHIVHVPSMALGSTQRALQVIEEAQAKGFDVTCDFYPYTAFGTGI